LLRPAAFLSSFDIHRPSSLTFLSQNDIYELAIFKLDLVEKVAESSSLPLEVGEARWGFEVA